MCVYNICLSTVSFISFSKKEMILYYIPGTHVFLKYTDFSFQKSNDFILYIRIYLKH